VGRVRENSGSEDGCGIRSGSSSSSSEFGVGNTGLYEETTTLLFCLNDITLCVCRAAGDVDDGEPERDGNAPTSFFASSKACCFCSASRVIVDAS